MAYPPTLRVVSGPAGAGKTTMAHKIAQALGCPAICRDEIKEGMVHAAASGFVAGRGDELTMRTLPVFFDVLALLLKGRGDHGRGGSISGPALAGRAGTAARAGSAGHRALHGQR